MRSILVLLAFTATASANESPPNPYVHTDDAVAAELMHGWGAVDSYGFSARWERETTAEISQDAVGAIASVSKLGGATAFSGGVTASFGIAFIPMIATRLEAGYADGHAPFVRGSVGVRFGYIEADYTYSHTLGGDGTGWLAPHAFTLSFAAPFRFGD